MLSHFKLAMGDILFNCLEHLRVRCKTAQVSSTLALVDVIRFGMF